MAQSTIAGDYGRAVVIPAILSEGTITVAARGYSSRGFYETVATFAKEVQKGDPVSLAIGATLTYPNTGGLMAVTRLVNLSGCCGRVVDEPRWVKVPSTAGTYPNLPQNVARKYYRIASVELFGVSNVIGARVDVKNAGDMSIGADKIMAVNAASSFASHELVLSDQAGSRTAFTVLTYLGTTTSGEYSMLVSAPTVFKASVVT